MARRGRHGRRRTRPSPPRSPRRAPGGRARRPRQRVGCVPAGGPAHARRGAPRAERLRAAAEAAWLAGEAPRALALLDEAEPLAADGARAPRRRICAAACSRATARCRRRSRVLRDGAAADREQDDPARASEILAEATYAAIYGGVAEDLEAMARRAAALAPRDAHARALPRRVGARRGARAARPPGRARRGCGRPAR